MARFPTRQAEVLQLAETIIAGLTGHPAVYPVPPVPADDLRTELSATQSAVERVVAAYATYEQALNDKDELLAGLAGMIKKDLRYAENAVDFEDDKLKLLGWSGRRARSALQRPGQVLMLEARRQAEGAISLDWKEPVDGGKIAAYRIQRRDYSGGQWIDAGMAVEQEITLNHQERGKEFEYRIIAVNKAGDGEPSNTVMAVL